MNNQCHCCLQRPSARDLRKPFTHLGITESYSVMFEECFAIHLIIDTDREQGICLECVDQLRGACHFKLQVLQCQADLRESWGWQQHVKAETDTEEAHTEVVNTEIDADILKGENTEDVNRLEKQNEVVTSDDEDINLVYSDEEPIEFENSTETPPVPPNKDALCEQPSLSEEPDMQPECMDDDPERDAGPALVFLGAESAVLLRARRQLAAACAVRLERLRAPPAPARRASARHTYACDMCTQRFNSKSVLMRHIGTHYRCDVCDKTFMMSACLTRHEQNCTENKQKERKLANKNTLSKSHGEVVLCYCDECGKGFKRKIFLSKHIQRSHSVRQVLNNSHSRIKRQVRLTQKKPFHCSQCVFKSSKRSLLQRHEMIHTGEKPFKCDFCDFKCSRKSSLQRHRRTHTGEKPFKCGICDYKCSLKKTLQNHQRIHSGEKPFICGYCDLKCSQKSNLRIHLRIHTGEKPFKCGICDYTCNRKHHLQSHEMIHTGEKPFKCGYCDFKCCQKSHLQTHLRIHTGEKPFKCGYCDYKSNCKTHLRRHEMVHRRAAV